MIPPPDFTLEEVIKLVLGPCRSRQWRKPLALGKERIKKVLRSVDHTS
jgi:hypothetical protein